MAKILLVEDEVHIAEPIRQQLERDRHHVEHVTHGREAEHRLRISKYDLIILDVMLPEVDGIQLCKNYRARRGDAPVLMLTARSSVDDKELGLDSGADDYLTKPFSLKELSARVRALLRRPSALLPTTLTAGTITLNEADRSVTVNGTHVDLVPKEFGLLEFFLRRPDHVFSADLLLERVWNSDSLASADTVRTHIKTLRKKLGAAGDRIVTVHGVGYKFRSGGEA